MSAELAPQGGLVGATIGGRYRIVRELGRGGMGVVFAAVQVDLDRGVAVKVLHATGDPDAEQRLLREARAAGSVGHPNVCDVYDLGRLPDGRQYVVMPMLNGRDLATELYDVGPASPQRVLWIVTSAARGLDVMHSKGLVHRDLKPENLFIVRHSDGSELLKILDFGLAARSDEVRLTQAGLTTGTPHYMSPEAADGAVPDRRGDVYSLATVAFEMLAGRLPFDDASPFRILQAKTSRDAPRMTTPERVFATEVEAVIARALSREPMDRYASAGEFATALARAIDASVGAAAPGQGRTVEVENPIFGPLTGSAQSIVLVPPKAAKAARALRETLEAPTSVPPAAMPSSPPSSERDVTTERDIPGMHSAVRRLAVPALLGALVLGGVGTWWALSSHTHGTTTPQQPERFQTPVPVVTPPVAPAPVVVAPVPVVTPPPVPVVTQPPVVAHHGTHETHDVPPVPVVVAPVPVVTPPSHAHDHENGDDGSTFRPDLERAQELTRSGMAALVHGSLGAAADQLHDATNAAPRYAPAWRGLGLAYERLGRQADAVRAYRHYLALSPSAPDAAEITARVERLGG